jgi:vancomycin resistance protein YoaR
MEKKKNEGGTREQKPGARSFRPGRFNHPVLLLALLVVALGIAGLATIQQAYAGRIYPGVRLGGIAVSGGTGEDAERQLLAYADELAEQGLTFTYGEKTVSLSPVVVPQGELDFAYELVSIDVEDSIDAALRVGRTGSVLGRQIATAASLLGTKQLSLTYAFDRAYLLDALTEEFADAIVPPHDAEYVLHDNGTLAVLPDADGITLNFDEVLDALEADIASGRIPQPLTLARITAFASVQERTLIDAFPAAQEVRARGSIRLTGPEGQVWEYSAAEVVSFVGVDKNGDPAAHFLNTKKALDRIGDAVVISPKNGKFERVGEKVQEFQVAAPGRKLDSEATRAALAELLFTEKNETAIVIAALEPEVGSEQIAELGLEDLIGVGHSNFAGSPPNRRHNIAVGAAAVNGTLIAPGEEFSLLKTLGRIDGSTGYLQELVIKGNKTIPEYGGGLCQIGTTTFRAALASGFPITKRQNHSYVVSYYNNENGLPGTDATIYDPAPDFRFVNDTGHYALFQTRIEGNDLIFEVWGTEDGRVAEQTEPRVYNRVAPPPTAYVETTDLAPGVEKCTERAHAGMDAEFTYTVTYPDGQAKAETFKSHYRPWQAVCLRGVAPPSA